MNTKFLKGVIGREAAAGSSTSPIAALCEALREGTISSTVLFRAYDTDEVFARGDVIDVKHTAAHHAHKNALVLQVTSHHWDGSLAYITDKGGPFMHGHCTLVQKASVVSLQRAASLDDTDEHDDEDDTKDASAEPGIFDDPHLLPEVELEPMPNMIQLSSIVRREIERYLGSSWHVRKFLRGRGTLEVLFAKDADKHVYGTREAELAEYLNDALCDVTRTDLTLNLTAREMSEVTFDEFVSRLREMLIDNRGQPEVDESDEEDEEDDW